MAVREKLAALRAITEEQQDYGTEVLHDLGILYDDGTIEGVNDNIPRMVARIDDTQTSSEYVWSSQKTQTELSNVASNASAALSLSMSAEVMARNAAISEAVSEEARARANAINAISVVIPSEASSVNKLVAESEIGNFIIAARRTGTSIALTDSADGYLQSVTVKGHSEKSGNLFDETRYQHIISDYDEQTTYYNVCEIPLKPNTTYTISQRAGTTVTDPIIMLNNQVSVNVTEGRLDLRQASGSVTVTTDSTGYLYIGAINNTGSTDAQVYARLQACKVQIEEGSTATTYEPYGIMSIGDNGFTITNTNNTDTTSATITTGLPLRSVSDTIFDTLDNDNVTKKCAEVDLGTLDFSYDSANTRFIASITGYGNEGARLTPMVCAAFTPISDGRSLADMPNNSIASGLNEAIMVKTTDYTNILDFIAAMSGVKLVYPLATPTETALSTAEKNALASLRTYNDTTHIDATDSPSITVDYLLNTTNGKAIANMDNKLRELFATSSST